MAFETLFHNAMNFYQNLSSHTQNFIMPMNFVGVSSKEAMHTSGGPCWVHTDVVLEMGSSSDANMYTQNHAQSHIVHTVCAAVITAWS